VGGGCDSWKAGTAPDQMLAVVLSVAQGLGQTPGSELAKVGLYQLAGEGALQSDGGVFSAGVAQAGRGCASQRLHSGGAESDLPHGEDCIGKDRLPVGVVCRGV
jgi:hypothetical protein